MSHCPIRYWTNTYFFQRRLCREMFALIPNRKRRLGLISKAAFCNVCNLYIRIILCPLVKWKYNKKQEDSTIEKIIWANRRYICPGWRLYSPNLILLAAEEQQYIGIWGQRHVRYLKQHHKILYYNLLTSGKLNAHLAEIDRQAEEMYFRLVKQIAEREGVTELLKAKDQMEWIRRMNSIRSRVAEIVYIDLIYV